jgi:hypothetical protein
MARLLNLLPPLVIGLLAIVFIVQAHGFKPASATVPILIGWTVLILALIDLATRLDGAVGLFMNRLFKPTKSLGTKVHEAGIALQVTAIASIALLVAGFLLLGILPSSAIFVVLALRFGARTGWVAALLSGLGIAALVWGVFAALLGLDLPMGILFDGGS